MSKPAPTIHEAADAFLAALCLFQKATLAKQQSVLKLNQHGFACYESLADIIQISGSAVTPRR